MIRNGGNNGKFNRLVFAMEQALDGTSKCRRYITRTTYSRRLRMCACCNGTPSYVQQTSRRIVVRTSSIVAGGERHPARGTDSRSNRKLSTDPTIYLLLYLGEWVC